MLRLCSPVPELCSQMYRSAWKMCCCTTIGREDVLLYNDSTWIVQPSASFVLRDVQKRLAVGKEAVLL